MINDDKINQIVDYHSDLTLQKRLLNKINLSILYTNKFKKWIFKNRNKFSNSEKIKIQTLVKNDVYKLAGWNQIELLKKINNFMELRDLKRNIQSDTIFQSNKIILEKELVQKQKYLLKLQNKLRILKNKNKSWIWKIQNLKVKIAKVQTRIKDLKEFLTNRSIYRKVFLSDEPPLNGLGWVKLILSYGILLFWIIIIIWPLFELVKATFNDNSVDYLYTSSHKFGFLSFVRLFEKTKYVKWLANTLIVAGSTSLITVATTLLMGYAFSRFRFKGKKSSLLSIMLLQMIPLLSALTVFYVIFTLLNQSFNISGHIVLIIIYVGGGIAGNTFIMKGYMDSISTDIDEAAKIDGLSRWKIFTRIIIPLTKPMIVLIAIWSFIGPFGDYILPGLLLSQSDDFTLARGLRTLVISGRDVDQAAFAAGSILISLPISILFISLRKFLVGGITAGGVKG